MGRATEEQAGLDLVFRDQFFHQLVAQCLAGLLVGIEVMSFVDDQHVPAWRI
ncbi:hypothetical protein D3C85_1515590 [compost metagenome]